MKNEFNYSTKSKALKAVTEDGNEFKYCTLELKNDEEVVMVAIKENSWAFEYASKDLKSNKTFIMKALHEGVDPWGLIKYTNISLQSDIEVITLAVEKSDEGWTFLNAKGAAALNKELAAKALVKFGNYSGEYSLDLWKNLNPTLQEFFPKESWYEKAKAYLIQLEQEKQAELVSGGSTVEDGVVW